MNEGVPGLASALEREEVMKGQEEQDSLQKLVGLKHLLCRGDHDRLDEGVVPGLFSSSCLVDGGDVEYCSAIGRRREHANGSTAGDCGRPSALGAAPVFFQI